MKVWIKAPGNDPVMADIPNDLKALQGWVNGYIEVFRTEPECAIICNEEGYIRDFPRNFSLYGNTFYGTILFVGLGTNKDGEDDFTDCPLSEQEVKELIA